MTFSEIQSKIQNAPTLEFGNIFSRATELFKKVWVQGLILQLLVLVIMSPFFIIFYIPIIGAIIEQSQSGYGDPNAINDAFYGQGPLYLLFFYLMIFVLSAVSAVLYAGFYRIVRKLDIGNEFQFSDFFHYFKSVYFWKAFFLMALGTVISFFAALLCVLPIFYVMIPIMFFIPIFAFNPELSVSNIMSLAFNLGTKKWGITFGLVILSSIIIYILILLTCGIGGLFLPAFIYLPIYLIYKDVIGFDDDSGNTDLKKIENI